MMRFSHAAAAVLVGALGVGCAHEQPPAAEPSNFESAVPPGQTTTPANRPMNDGLTGPAFAPGKNGPNGALTPPDTTGAERQLCSDLQRDASMRVEDVSNGVAIVMMPKANVDLVSVRNEVRGIERSMTRLQAGNDAGHTGGGASCPLFDLSRGGALVTVTEQPNAMRLVVISDDADSVRRVRSVSRAFVAHNVGY